MKRNWQIPYALAVILSVPLGYYLSPLTAHAQKPAEQPTIVGVVPTVIGSWIEQYCVAILINKQDVKHEADGSLIYVEPVGGHISHDKPWTEHIAEHDLKLRCK